MVLISLSLLGGATKLKVIDRVLDLWMKLFASFFVVPKDVALGNDSKATWDKPDAHIHVIVGLCRNNCPSSYELWQINIDGPPAHKNTYACQDEVGSQTGSDPDHMFVDIWCRRDNYYGHGHDGDEPEERNVCNREVKKITDR